MHLKGQVAVVTGGGRGIGRAIARKFAAEGAAVVVAARSEKEIYEVMSEIQSAGGKAAAVTADLARETDCKKIVDGARAAFGQIDNLVNNAAIYGPVAPVVNFPVRDWDLVMQVNLRAPMILCQLVLPEMYARKSGSILRPQRRLHQLEIRTDRADPRAGGRSRTAGRARERDLPGTGNGDENVAGSDSPIFGLLQIRRRRHPEADVAEYFAGKAADG
jgi:NAD(P)-dependent dehydrogenase (short-subunit alcohol dehydrogenase family)